VLAGKIANSLVLLIRSLVAWAQGCPTAGGLTGSANFGLEGRKVLRKRCMVSPPAAQLPSHPGVAG